MQENLFFDKSKLKACGSNVIIGLTARIRYPELVSIADNVIIDDFTYISTQLHIDEYVHISSGCKIIGGKNATVKLGSFSTLAPNVVLAAGSDDYSKGIAGPHVPLKFKGDVEVGYIDIGKHSIVGANSTILPNVSLFEGAVVGANSMAKTSLDAWTINAGVPTDKIGQRDRERTEQFEAQFQRSLENGR